MLTVLDKKTLFQDKYQILVMPVPVSGIFRQRQLLRLQSLYPDFYQNYQQACEHSQLILGQNLIFPVAQELSGMGVASALAKPKFLVAMAVTEFAEHLPHLDYILACFLALSPILDDWGRFDGIRRVALLLPDELILPKNCTFEMDILPLVEKYLQANSRLHLVIYR